MKRWQCILLLAATISFSAYAVTGYSAQATKSPVGANREIVGKIRGLQKAIISVTGIFLMEIPKNREGIAVGSEGKVTFKAPSSWRIEQYNPADKTPIYTAGCNGKSFWYDDGDSGLIKTNVEKLSTDQQNILVQSTGFSPLCVFNEGLIANISSIVDGQGNTWIFKIVPDKDYLAMVPADINVDEVRWEVSKETGLLKSGEWFYRGEKFCSVKFKDIKIESALTAP